MPLGIGVGAPEPDTVDGSADAELPALNDSNCIRSLAALGPGVAETDGTAPDAPGPLLVPVAPVAPVAPEASWPSKVRSARAHRAESVRPYSERA